MLANYDFLSPQRIHFGWGRRREVGDLAKTLGERAFLVLGSRTLRDNGTVVELEHFLRAKGIAVEILTRITREPTVSDVDEASNRLRDVGVREGDFLIALGGGAAIDLAKAAGAVAVNRHGGSVLDFLEGVGRGLQITVPPIPLLAMPTTGGTGTEATKNAVISVFSPPVKKSIRSPMMVPSMVLIDPELAISVPAETTAWTGMDAITQLIESYICKFARPIPQALAIQGLTLALPRMREVVRDGGSRPAREAFAHAALLSGMALANSGLGLAHGVAAALGAIADVPHGLACAMMLPVALRVNREVAEKALAELACAALPGSMRTDAEAADALIAEMNSLCADLNVPTRLRQVGVQPAQLDDLVRGSRGNSMNGNPVLVSDTELKAILEEML